MVIRAKVVLKGVLPGQMILKIKDKMRLLEGTIDRLGQATARQMQEVIAQETYRSPSTGNLASSIKAEKIPEKRAIGVGRILDLPPYWYVMNFGETVGGAKFIPGLGKEVRGDFGGARPDPNLAGTSSAGGSVKARMNHPGKYMVQAKNPVHPKNYIEKTANWLSLNWVGILRNSGA